MKVLCRYFILKYKSCLNAFVKSILGILIVFVLLITGVAVVSFGFQNEQILPKIKVGMVIPESESFIQKGMPFLSSMDSIESICEFHYMEENEAREGLEMGDLQVVIILPVNFLKDVQNGTNTPAEILMTEDVTMSNEVFKEVLTAGISYLQIAESGVYATLDIAQGEKLKVKSSRIGYILPEYYLKALFDRMDIYEEVVISPFGEIDFSEYIVVMIFILTILLVGSDFSVLYEKNEKVVEQKLKQEGINSLLLTLTKICIIATSLWAIWVVCYLGICVISEVFSINILWWDFIDLGYAFLFCVSVGAFFHFVYELTQNPAQGSILLLFFNIGMVLCSGIILPSAYLSDGAKLIGKYMPVSLWSEYIQNVLFDIVTVEQIVTLLIFIFIEILAGAVIVWKNI